MKKQEQRSLSRRDWWPVGSLLIRSITNGAVRTSPPARVSLALRLDLDKDELFLAVVDDIMFDAGIT